LTTPSLKIKLIQKHLVFVILQKILKFISIVVLRLFLNQKYPNYHLKFFFKISHSNIISSIKVEKLEDSYFIFIELCKRSTLLDMFNTCASLSEDNSKYIFEQLVSAFEYLHLKRYLMETSN
jgi:serine/threonine protein kinase